MLRNWTAFANGDLRSCKVRSTHFWCIQLIAVYVFVFDVVQLTKNMLNALSGFRWRRQRGLDVGLLRSSHASKERLSVDEDFVSVDGGLVQIVNLTTATTAVPYYPQQQFSFHIISVDFFNLIQVPWFDTLAGFVPGITWFALFLGILFAETNSFSLKWVQLNRCPHLILQCQFSNHIISAFSGRHIFCLYES